MPEESATGEGLFFVLFWLLIGGYCVAKGFWLGIASFLAK